MERPQNFGINPRIAVVVIILFHIVGLVGLMLPVTRPLFLQIVPWHLLLMFLVIVFGHNYINKKFIAFLVVTFLGGILAEWIGVHKQWLFGHYAYGPTLGTKVFDIPLTIGINWFLLVYATGVTMQRSRLKSMFARVVVGALLLVLLDLLIEPVAIRFDYWQWADNIIPLKNYYCWFLVSAVMLLAFEKAGFKKQSIVAPVLLATEFVFFGVLVI
ncbi:carotenoid biosynthesis protein [Mucilaginibacter pedocola]|uniref:Carotenoid biosynthesis protein n=1 Tax=Mucilaginibacter pedocola TaxID=1792845 RepID=A0A1S9PD57_9SPHI|nr:carotenoid biosynthesis protein [Mucilaginibacter pedocola]OOQ58859.1 hypothetical protein BC343_09450 [Mucilaginibacter pedocola]